MITRAPPGPCALVSAPLPAGLSDKIMKKYNTCFRITAAGLGGDRKSATFLDAIDVKQQVDIERLINCVQELQDK